MNNQLVLSRDVVFDESATWKWEDEDVDHGLVELTPLVPFVQFRQNVADPSRNNNYEDNLDSDAPPRKQYSSSEIYESCNVVLFVSE